MKMHLDCVPCLQRQVVQAARLATNDEKLQEQILRETLQALLQSDWSTRPTIMVATTQNIIAKITGNADPYLTIKSQYNHLALSLYSDLQAQINVSNDPLLTALKLSIAGNIIDFGTSRSFNVNETIIHVLATLLTVDHSQILRQRLSAAKQILFLADNAGEIVFDKLLIETILKEYSIEKIVFVVKKEPIINDAMVSDSEEIGLTKDIPQVELFEVGPDRCDPSFLSFLQQFDVIISKGQANYEDLKDFTNIFFLFIVKCALVADETGFPEGSTLLKYSGEDTIKS